MTKAYTEQQLWAIRFLLGQFDELADARFAYLEMAKDYSPQSGIWGDKNADADLAEEVKRMGSEREAAKTIRRLREQYPLRAAKLDGGRA